MVLSPRRGWEVVQAGPYGVHSSQISVSVLFLFFFVCRTGALLNADCRSCDSLMNYGSRSSNYQVMRVLVSLLWELRFSTSFVTALPYGYL